jgi:hypothetical protein
MKSVKEIKEMRKNWLEKGGWGLGIEYLFDIVLGITEHLTKPAEWTENAITGDVISMTSTTKAEIERAATIKALRWVRSMIEGGIAYVTLVHWIDDAITRLEEGGEL